MSESYREQFPLLCDDLSDEEHFSPQYHRQYRQMIYRGRARSNVKGAVAIIKRWPEHWSSFLTYWWIGVVMICLMTFILYNCLFAFSVIPTANFKPIKSQVPKLNNIQFAPQEYTHFSHVYVHVFTNDNKEAKLNQYLPHIEAMANKHPTFSYHIQVVINDTDVKELNAEDNNANALNSLWTEDIIKNDKSTKSRIKIEHIGLTKYLDSSPLSKYWRTLPNQVIEFLVRAISIWDKGGITFNPMILTSLTSSSAYIEKLENIFESYRHFEIKDYSHKRLRQPMKYNVNNQKLKQKVNNIRDIIHVLENENNINIEHDEILAEAESKTVEFGASNTDKRLISKRIHSSESINKRDTLAKPLNNNEFGQEGTQTVQNLANSNNTSSLTIMPSFLEYLFHRNTNNHGKGDLSNESTEYIINNGSNKKMIKSDFVLDGKNKTKLNSKNSSKEEQIMYRPMIIPANEAIIAINETSTNVLYQYGNENDDQHLTIDLKGNLLATKTACHAFLGTIFTDAIHCGHDETLPDFLIKELSIFCKGVLSSCSGIDLILL